MPFRSSPAVVSLTLALAVLLAPNASAQSLTMDAGFPADAGPPLAVSAAPATGEVVAGETACLESGDVWGPLAMENARKLLEGASGAGAGASEVRLTGLHVLDETAVLKLVGLSAQPVRPLRFEELALVVGRLLETELFATVTPSIQRDGAGRATLVIALTEYPSVSQVELRGLRETRAEDLLPQLLPAAPEDGERGRETYPWKRNNGSIRFAWDSEEKHSSFSLGWSGDDDARPEGGCAWPAAPAAWLARTENGEVKPGIVRGGLEDRLRHVLDDLHDHGYVLASLRGELDPQGRLRVEVDEGLLQRIELRGVDPALESNVRELLELQPNQPFLASELTRGLKRVHRAYPFLHPDDEYRLYPESDVKLAPREGGGLRFGSGRPEGHGFAFEGRHTWHFRFHWPHGWRHREGREDDRDDSGDALDGVDFEDGALVIHFYSERWTDPDVDWVELMRHTQVTGFAPGLGARFKRWDPSGRAHLALDAQLNVNTRRPGQSSSGDVLQQLGAQERIDWLVGPLVALPKLHVAELGAQVHVLTDTADRWRTDRMDAYAGSLWNNRPSSEYFRRTGATAFLTTSFFDQLLLGGEYRFDRYDNLEPLGHLWTITNSRAVPWPNPSIDPGEWGSVLVRAEWSSWTTPMNKVGDRYRDPERSLVDREQPETSGFRTLATFELADPALGGDGHYTRVVSDSLFYLATGDDLGSGLKLRFRAAGGNGLPAQKREGLGGWEALRGYGFKEFRGDRSLLGTAEYQFAFARVFADLGTVRAVDGWVAPRLGLGAGIDLGDEAHLEFAWRTDSQARADPSVRLLFQRSF